MFPIVLGGPPKEGSLSPKNHAKSKGDATSAKTLSRVQNGTRDDSLLILPLPPAPLPSPFPSSPRRLSAKKNVHKPMLAGRVCFPKSKPQLCETKATVDGRNPSRTTKETLVSIDSPVNTNERYGFPWFPSGANRISSIHSIPRRPLRPWRLGSVAWTVPSSERRSRTSSTSGT